MAKGIQQLAYSQIHLPPILDPEVDAWSKQGWSGVTQTTHDLLSYWFNRDEETQERFYLCQQRAIETVIYCHEVLQVKTLEELYERLAPRALLQHLPLKTEVESTLFPKYCLKMATGTGKTWVLAALLLWQYFNSLRGEHPGWYSNRFLIVVPGHEVLNRLLDSFKGRRDLKTSQRDPATSDYARALFMPEGTRWRDQFHLDIYEPSDVRANTSPPDGPFVLLTNWQQFRLREGTPSLWEQWTGEDVEEQPRGEVIADFLSEFPDLVVMNDEAHHVHGKKTTRNEELVWRHFMGYLHESLTQKHPKERGLFMQVDFSATPFYGSGANREYFPHIVYDYDLVQAMREMLVKQLFLEERQSIAGERLDELDFRAERTEAEGRKRGEIKSLSPGQKLMLDIGRRKLEQLTQEFEERDIARKPVMMVLAEETDVALLVEEYFSTLSDEHGRPYDQSQVMRIHTPDKEAHFTDADLEEARKRLDAIDDDNDPLRVIISVLMLREGFDKTNICVTVVLRATEADLLLEQIVGRGLRLMFPGYRYPEFWDAKKEAVEDLRRRRMPSNSLDFLFIVEHPRFRAFYDELRQQGYLIGGGDTSKTRSTGDLIPIDAVSERISAYDIAWPVQIFEQGKLPDLSQIDIASLPKYPTDFEQLRRMLAKLAISDTHLDTGTRAKTWKLDNQYFDFAFFLRQASHAVASAGKESPILTAKHADIAALLDEYVSDYLFGQPIDFSLPENYNVLNFTLVFDHVVQHLRRAILTACEQARYSIRQGVWGRLSKLERITVRESRSITAEKCIYPRQGYSAVGGGFERDFMRETLSTSPGVQAYAKLTRRHGLVIPYRDADGIQRDYEVDFVVREPSAVYLVETKADKDLSTPSVALKARAAQAWCESASGLPSPEDLPQPTHWEYLLLSEGLFKANRGLSFEALVPLCQALREKVIAQQQGKLF
jgi:type III restriction enzyme